MNSPRFGSSVGTAGDVNGDGYADVIVGDVFFSLGGAAFVFLGSASGLQSTPAWTVEGGQTYGRFGTSVATAGDVNGDGYSDVIIGADYYDGGHGHAGQAFAYLGSPSGLQSTPSWTAAGTQANAYLGRSVSTAGDVNGDGYSDVIVGAPDYSNGHTHEGIAYVYLGSPSGLATTAAWTVESNANEAQFGNSVGTAGDVNGDGYAEIIVGEPGFSHPETQEGRAVLYFGSASGPLTAGAWVAESDQASAYFSTSVATAGDVNGDGYADVVVGAPRYSNVETREGRAFLYYGNGGPGVSLVPRQRRSDDAAPIAHLCGSDSTSAFRLALTGRSPMGRGRARLEWEVKPLGTTFNGLGTQIGGSLADTGVGGAPLNETVSGLLNDKPYHWRVRLRYDPARTPFAQRSRWLTMPWKGWQETMLRTTAPPAGRVPDGWTGDPLRVTKGIGDLITLTWGVSCNATDSDYEVYEGTIGSYYGHVAMTCSTAAGLTWTFNSSVPRAYYLVVPRKGLREGSYGVDSSGNERPAGTVVCLPRLLGACDTCTGGRFPGASCSGSQDCPGACIGRHDGESCLTNDDCHAACSNDPQVSCTSDARCRFCFANHNIVCTSNAQCAPSGSGPCTNPGTCVGTCTNPDPGTCSGP